MDKIKIVALGGLDENGRDCYAIEINDDFFIVDAGAALPDKNAPGVDYIIPNASYIFENKSRLKGYIMTHGHDEQMAGLKYFYQKAPAPIYCTNTTKILIEHQALISAVKCNFEFVIKKPTDDFVIAGHKIHFFQTAHNMANSCGVAIETDQGNIIYTGDFIVDFDVTDPGYYFDLKGLSRICEKPTLCLLAESKSANKEGFCAPRHRITPKIEKVFKDGHSRIFISCFWQNFFRIKEICKLVKTYKKKLYFYDAYTAEVMKILLETDPALYSPSDVVPSSDLLRTRSNELVILMLGVGKELYDNINTLANGDNEDKRMNITKEDTFISAAIATPTLEMMSVRTVDNLYRTGCNVVWISGKDVTAMHARHDDLKLFLTLSKPKYYFPIRGNFTNQMDNAKLALGSGLGLNYSNILVMDNGAQVVFENGRARVINPRDSGIEVDPVLVDGKGISTVAQSVIDERIRLSEDGVVVVASTVSLSEKRIVSGPDCQMRGFVYVKEAEPMLKSFSEIYIDEINTELTKTVQNFEDVKNRVIERSQRFIKRENGRAPLIVPIIVVTE